MVSAIKCVNVLLMGLFTLTLALNSRPQAEAPHNAAPDERYWVEAMQKVHAKFTGRRGTFAHFGDSITVSLAFWTPLLYERKNASPEMEQAFKLVKDRMQPECWRDWKGPEFGNEGTQTSRWALANVDTWLKNLNPEVALIMFGTNDLHQMEVEEYRDKMRAVVQKCLDNGTVVILSTIPPRHGFDKKTETFVAALRDLARDLKVPLTDYYAEILKRRPNDWDGADEKWKEYDGYEVPTLISRDGVHPSNPKAYQNDYSEQGLKSNGFGLRSYLTLLKYAEVLQALDKPLAAVRPAPRTTGGNLPVSGQGAPVVPASGTTTLPNQNNSSLTRVPSQPWFPKAPPLPAPAGEVIRVANVAQLFAAAERIRPGGTILIADGLYQLGRRLEIKTDNVTVRGASGQRDRVILDGGNMGELLALTACSGVTIADLTVQNVKWNGIKFNSETGVHRATIYNCVLHNIWQRAIKGVKVPEENRERLRPNGCRIQYCLFYNDRRKQFADDSSDTAQTFGGNYIGGIDVMYAKGWTISDNVFTNIKGRTGEARGAIFMWQQSEDCLIERNIIIDCDSGICLGNSHLGDSKIHCTNFIVRNNFVTRAPENGILADYTRDCKILNNTVYDPQSRLGRLIRIVHDNDGLLVANNLLCGPKLRNESQSRMDITHNLEKDLSAALVAAAEGNLRLTAGATDAINQGTPLPEVRDDIDRQPRDRVPDIGADEFKE